MEQTGPLFSAQMPAAAPAPPRGDQASKKLVNPLCQERPQMELVAPLSWPTRPSGLRLLYRDADTSAPVAVKCFDRRKDRVKHFVRQEVLTHRRLRHPNLLEFKEVTLSNDYFCVLTEHAAGGDLWRYVQKAGQLQEPLARWFLQNHVLGLDYCHKRGVFNINPDCNLLQKLSGFPLPLLKISDFGYSRSLFTEGRQRIVHVGTLAYMAPEMLLGAAYDRRRSDVWSCGVLLYLMLYGRFPFDSPPSSPPASHSPDRLLQQQQPMRAPKDSASPRQEHEQLRLQSMIGRIVKRQWAAVPEPTVPVSHACLSLLEWMLQEDASQRPSVAQVLQHAWVLEGLPANASALSTQLLDTGLERPGLQSVEQVLAVLQTPEPAPHVLHAPTTAKYDTLVDDLVAEQMADGEGSEQGD